MKIMFISDIHGIKTNLEFINKRFNELKCDKLVVLGDLFYIGPRNTMTNDYDIKTVVEFLNSYKDKIICIKGNCDSEVDNLVCNFPIIEQGLIEIDDLSLYLTHGHIYNEENWSYENSILIYGHYHIPFIKTKGSNTFMSPGSISLSKDDNKLTYMIYNDRKFTIYNENDEKICGKSVVKHD